MTFSAGGLGYLNWTQTWTELEFSIMTPPSPSLSPGGPGPIALGSADETASLPL